jgi:hypothetical protein
MTIVTPIHLTEHTLLPVRICHIAASPLYVVLY